MGKSSSIYPSGKWTILILCLPIVLLGQDERAKRIDSIFQQWNNTSGPGAAVSAIQEGRMVIEKGYGLANLEYQIPIGAETIFHVASVSKQFTAMALVLLEQDGKLTIDDEVHKYLPELPNYGHPIKIRNLLQHTSGIRDQWQTLALAGWSLEDVITQDQILRMLFRQQELNFVPGTEHLYSNGGYTLAAEIVTRVSGKPFPQFCADRIFKPLGMTHTHFHQDLHKIVKNRAYSYSGTDGAYEALPLNYANVGATSLFTTATDLTKWLDNFRKALVGGKAAIARLTEQGVLSNGKTIDYALGVSIGKQRGLRTISHSGGDAGFRSYVCWYPDQQLGVAVLSNLAGFDPGAAADKVAAVYVGSMMTSESAKITQPGAAKENSRTHDTPKAVTDFSAYRGTYWSEELETQYTFSIDNGKLIATHTHHGVITLTPKSKDSFSADQWFMADVNFIRDNAGRVTAVTLGGGRIRGIRFVKKQS